MKPFRERITKQNIGPNSEFGQCKSTHYINRGKKFTIKEKYETAEFHMIINLVSEINLQKGPSR